MTTVDSTSSRRTGADLTASGLAGLGMTGTDPTDSGVTVAFSTSSGKSGVDLPTSAVTAVDYADTVIATAFRAALFLLNRSFNVGGIGGTWSWFGVGVTASWSVQVDSGGERICQILAVMHIVEKIQNLQLFHFPLRQWIVQTEVEDILKGCILVLKAPGHSPKELSEGSYLQPLLTKRSQSSLTG